MSNPTDVPIAKWDTRVLLDELQTEITRSPAGRLDGMVARTGQGLRFVGLMLMIVVLVDLALNHTRSSTSMSGTTVFFLARHLGSSTIQIAWIVVTALQILLFVFGLALVLSPSVNRAWLTEFINSSHHILRRGTPQARSLGIATRVLAAILVIVFLADFALVFNRFIEDQRGAGDPVAQIRMEQWRLWPMRLGAMAFFVLILFRFICTSRNLVDEHGLALYPAVVAVSAWFAAVLCGSMVLRPDEYNISHQGVLRFALMQTAAFDLTATSLCVSLAIGRDRRMSRFLCAVPRDGGYPGGRVFRLDNATQSSDEVWVRVEQVSASSGQNGTHLPSVVVLALNGDRYHVENPLGFLASGRNVRVIWDEPTTYTEPVNGWLNGTVKVTFDQLGSVILRDQNALTSRGLFNCQAMDIILTRLTGEARAAVFRQHVQTATQVVLQTQFHSLNDATAATNDLRMHRSLLAAKVRGLIPPPTAATAAVTPTSLTGQEASLPAPFRAPPQLLDMAQEIQTAMDEQAEILIAQLQSDAQTAKRLFQSFPRVLLEVMRTDILEQLNPLIGDEFTEDEAKRFAEQVVSKFWNARASATLTLDTDRMRAEASVSTLKTIISEAVDPYMQEVRSGTARYRDAYVDQVSGTLRTIIESLTKSRTMAMINPARRDQLVQECLSFARGGTANPADSPARSDTSVSAMRQRMLSNLHTRL